MCGRLRSAASPSELVEGDELVGGGGVPRHGAHPLLPQVQEDAGVAVHHTAIIRKLVNFKIRRDHQKKFPMIVAPMSR